MKLECYDLRLDDSGRSQLVVVGNVVCDGRLAYNRPDIIYALMRDKVGMCKFAEEYVYMLALNTKCKMIGMFQVSKGSVNASIVGPRECLIRALAIGAASIVLVRNHPSQDVTPSNDDKLVTQRMREAGALVGVPLSDHIIVGDGYYSFRENNRW